MAALLALGGAACWGVGDFLGGLAARRTAVIAVLAISQAIGLAGVLVWVVVAQEAIPGVVTVRVVIDKSGKVTDAQASGGDWLLRGAASAQRPLGF